jgi:hypothetical protein
MNKKILFLTILILTLGCRAQKKEFSLLGKWKLIEEISSDGANKIRIPIKNGETLIFEYNNVVKNEQGDEGKYEVKGDSLHIAIPKKERFYFFRQYKEDDFEKIFLTPVTSEYKIICDEACTEIYEKIDNETEIKNRKVYGVVKDSIELVPGANVIIEGTNRETQTDFDGKYSIKVNPNEFLLFSYIGKKTQRIIADKNEINVQLREMEPLKEEVGPAYYPAKPKRIDPTTIVSKKDIVYADNPKYNFNKNAKKNVYVIFVSELTTYDFSKEDLEFQENYNIKYSLIGNLKNAYLVKYNKLTFKYLHKKYKKKWQTKIRKDAVGLEKALK